MDDETTPPPPKRSKEAPDMILFPFFKKKVMGVSFKINYSSGIINGR